VPAEEINELTDELRGCQTGFNMANAVYYKVCVSQELSDISPSSTSIESGDSTCLILCSVGRLWRSAAVSV